jgi:hypothetical protein
VRAANLAAAAAVLAPVHAAPQRLRRGTAEEDAFARKHLHAEEAASDDDASMGRREEVESSSDELSSGEEGSSVDSSSVSSASEASGDRGVDEGVEAGLGVAPLRQRVPKALITDLHRLKPRRKCKHGCGALVWREEGKLCCKGGAHILVPVYNPPIDPEYLAILQLPHMSADSRLLNERLAMGALSVSPSRSMGGLGFHEQRIGHVSLLGTYTASCTAKAATMPLLTTSCPTTSWWMALPLLLPMTWPRSDLGVEIIMQTIFLSTNAHALRGCGASVARGRHAAQLRHAHPPAPERHSLFQSANLSVGTLYVRSTSK